jgi:hypothetical protein
MARLELALEVVVLDDRMLVRMRKGVGRHQGRWNFACPDNLWMSGVEK